MKGSPRGRSSARSSSTTPGSDPTVLLLDVPGLKARDPLSLLPEGTTHAGLLFPGEALTPRWKKIWNSAVQAGWYCFRQEGCAGAQSAAGLAYTLVRLGEVVVIVSDDSVLLQLAGPRVTVRSPSRRRAYDPAAVRRAYGVEPWQIPDYFTLAGHRPWGIPGCLGLSRGVARRLLEKFSGVEELLARLDLLEIHGFPRPGHLQSLLDKQAARLRADHRKLHLDTGAEWTVTRDTLMRKKYAMLI
jgi:5'-3' exonuclease